jgi:hypothetical protein
MWKQPPKITSDTSSDDVPIHVPSTESESRDDAARPPRVGVRIIRPDGSVRDVTVAGHFREEHLCSLVDDELCRLKDRESLILHLYQPDGELTHSLRSRWQEGLSDNRRVFVREVLGPTRDPRQLSGQLEQIRQRIAAGERINLAIRSPHVAAAARDELRELLLISQRFDDALLNVWVHGDDDHQRRILSELEAVGLVRLRDCEQFVAGQPDRRWKMPWVDFEPLRHAKKTRRRKRKHISSEQAVSDWIRRVEEDREQSHH